MCDILVVDRAALLSQLIEYHARANRIPEDDHIGDQAQRAKLILLPVAVALTQLPALTVKHFTSHAVVTLATIEWDERRATFILIVNAATASASTLRLVTGGTLSYRIPTGTHAIPLDSCLTHRMSRIRRCTAFSVSQSP